MRTVEDKEVNSCFDCEYIGQAILDTEIIGCLLIHGKTGVNIYDIMWDTTDLNDTGEPKFLLGCPYKDKDK